MLKKNDFVELDFIAKVKETNAVFDTTILEEAEKAGLLHEKEKDKGKFKPIKVCIGQGMLLQGLDKALEGKEIEKWHEIEILPKEAFGERDSKLVRILPLKAFREKGIEPVTGMTLGLDNILVRIAAVSSGRVITDFNNPLSGKNIIYKFRINKKIDDNKEKLEILAEFFLGKAEKVNIENGKGIVEFKIKIPEAIEKEFAKKAKDILNMDVEIKEIKEVKENKEKEKAEKARVKTEKKEKSAEKKEKEKQEEKIKTKEEDDGKIRTERPYNE